MDHLVKWAMALALPLCLMATPLKAEQPLSGAKFEALVTGWTLQFKSGGKAYGAEQYLPGRRVFWAFDGDQCKEGRWEEPVPNMICFHYEPGTAAQCWAFYENEGRLRAEFQGSIGGLPLTETQRSRDPLACSAPELGV